VKAKPNALPWLLLSVLVIALDQWTKHIALGSLEYLRPVAVIPGFLNWTLAFNTGAAFSFLAGESGWQRWLFTALAIGVSAALALLLDRTRFGHVTDFIEVYWHDWSFPAFNVADSAICVGAFLLILFGFAGRKAPAGGG